MYDIVVGIIGLGTNNQEVVYSICGALICILTVVVVDFIKDIFSGFIRG